MTCSPCSNSRSVRRNRASIFQDDEGFRQRLWSVTDANVLAKVVQIMNTKQLFIADGHHRYETALNYRRARRQQAGAASSPQPYDNVLMLFASLEDKGLTVLPTHRVLTTPVPAPKDLLGKFEPVFDVTALPFQAAMNRRCAQFIERLRNQGQSVPMFGLALKNDSNYYLLTLRASHRPTASTSPRDRLDVSLLQQHVVSTLCPTQQTQEAIRYSKDDHEALDWVRQGAPVRPPSCSIRPKWPKSKPSPRRASGCRTSRPISSPSRSRAWS